MKKTYCAMVLMAALLGGLSLPADAQTAPSTKPAGQPANWTLDQAVTCSVHDAWVLGGRTEDGFFAIVEALTQLAEQKRDLTLPDQESVGRQYGEYIKTQAKADHDQLLYAIVDRAVRKFGVPAGAGK